MILKFANLDMFNTSLVDPTSGRLEYSIETTLDDAYEEIEDDTLAFQSFRTDDKFGTNSENGNLSIYLPPPPPPNRRTRIYDGRNTLLGEIKWRGRKPEAISFGGKQIGGLTELFGSVTAQLQSATSSSTLNVPARFDENYHWEATASSLKLINRNCLGAKGQFVQNCIRVRNRFLGTHVPGLGRNYLEFEVHPRTFPAELIVSFLLMEILRRGRFHLTPYAFENSKIWHFREAKDAVSRSIRRSKSWRS